MIKNYKQIVDKKGNLKSLKCPECDSNAMYFNFHRTLICRNCGYTPTCPTCKRHYHADDTFQFEKDTEWMRRPDGNTDIKSELVYLISNLAMLIQQSYTRDSKSKKQLVYDLDRFLKSYNDHYHLEIDRYTDKPDDIKHQIRLKEHKIEKLKRDLDYQKNWHEDRIENLQEELKKLKSK